MTKERAEVFLEEILQLFIIVDANGFPRLPFTIPQDIRLNIEKTVSLKIQKIYDEDPSLFLDVIELHNVISHKGLFGNLLTNSHNLPLELLDKLSHMKEISTEENIQRIDFIIKGNHEIRDFKETIPFPTTLLDIAIIAGSYKLVNKLIELGAEISLEQQNLCAYLDAAFMSLNHSLYWEERNNSNLYEKVILYPGGNDLQAKIKYFAGMIFDGLKVKANINKKLPLSDQTPLQIAIELDSYSHFQVIWKQISKTTSLTAFLLTQGANANVQDMSGNTPLHNVLRQGNLRLAKLLLAYTYPIIENNYGLLPIDIARQENHTEIINIIESKSTYFKERVAESGVTPTKSDVTSRTKEEKFACK